jgi:outer membrane immunogenic protein
LKKALLAGAIAVPIAAIASTAQPSVAVAQVSSPNWSGGYFTGTAGGAWGTSSQKDNGVFTGPTGPSGPSGPADGHYNISGPAIGGGFGFNWQSGQWVAGLETDLSWTDIKGDTTCGLGTNCGTKIEALGTVRARLGMLLGGAPAYSGMPTKAAPVVVNYGPLVYVTGGFAYARVHAWDDFSPSSGTKWAPGWTVGGGAEWKLTGNWTAKLEYLYVDLQRKHIFDIVPGTPEFVDANMHVVRFGLSYQFSSGGWGPVTAKY